MHVLFTWASIRILTDRDYTTEGLYNHLAFLWLQALGFTISIIVSMAEYPASQIICPRPDSLSDLHALISTPAPFLRLLSTMVNNNQLAYLVYNSVSDSTSLYNNNYFWISISRPLIRDDHINMCTCIDRLCKSTCIYESIVYAHAHIMHACNVHYHWIRTFHWFWASQLATAELQVRIKCEKNAA